MFRLKTLGVLAGFIAVLALSAIPASAEFKSTQSQGNINILNAGEFKDSGIPVTCPKEEIKAQYHIQTKGQIKGQQKQTTKGPHLLIQVKSWGTKCKATVLGLGIPTTVKPCDFQLVQRTSEGQKEAGSPALASGGVATSCLLKIGVNPEEPTCELQIPTGMETAQETDQGINVGLETAELKNSGANLIAKINATKGGKGQLGTGIRVEPVGGKGCPITSVNEGGTLTGVEGEAIGLNA